MKNGMKWFAVIILAGAFFLSSCTGSNAGAYLQNDNEHYNEWRMLLEPGTAANPSGGKVSSVTKDWPISTANRLEVHAVYRTTKNPVWGKPVWLMGEDFRYFAWAKKGEYR